MSWIQENRFAAALGGITAIAAGGLIFWGASAGSKYNKAKEEYDTAAGDVDRMETSQLYPNQEHVQSKKKALDDYREGVGELQKAYEPFRPGQLPLIEPSDFTDNLKKARDAAAKALADAGTEVPAEFFLGFESYTNSPVRKEATGILGYQMDAIAKLFHGLAAAKPTKLLNVYRPALEEESGRAFDPAGKTFRALPVEIVFNGPESSLRDFLSSLDDASDAGNYYYVIRSIRISNEKQKAPTASDAAFKKPEEDASAGSGASDIFAGGGFVLPGDDTPDAGDAAAEEPAAEPPAASSDEGKILEQVLGTEKINVFLRIDILQFLPAQDLPKP